MQEKRQTNVPLPDNEAQRLEALRDYAILDTPPEEVFDDFTVLASLICGVPFATISLVDEDRQWFKSRIGIEDQETSRDVAFCAHTIMGKEVMVVPDAALDVRFADSPLVTSGSKIRFYAGAPLITPDGHHIGALCALDNKPHQLTKTQEQALAALARQLIAHLELQRVSGNLAEALEKIKVMGGMIPICSYCKSIRDDKGFWESLEAYLDDHADVELTHGICNACLALHFPEDGDQGTAPPPA